MEFATSESILISEMSYSMEQICEMPIRIEVNIQSEYDSKGKVGH